MDASQRIVLVFVAILVIAAVVFLSRQASFDIAGPLRTWLWARDARRMAARKKFPTTLRRSYWNEEEYRSDKERLEALGYGISATDSSEPYVTPFAWDGRGQPPRRRVPIHHVVYTHSESASRSSRPPE